MEGAQGARSKLKQRTGFTVSVGEFYFVSALIFLVTVVKRGWS